MAKKKSLFAESTEVPVQRTVSEIISLLVGAGARSVNTEFAAGGKIESLSFVMPFGRGLIPYQLPVRTEPVFKKLNSQRTNSYTREQSAVRDREQAERIAWRQLYWWLKAQLAMIDLGMVQTGEVLMPYALDRDGRTLFEHYSQKVLAAPAEGGQ